MRNALGHWFIARLLLRRTVCSRRETTSTTVVPHSWPHARGSLKPGSLPSSDNDELRSVMRLMHSEKSDSVVISTIEGARNPSSGAASSAAVSEVLSRNDRGQEVDPTTGVPKPELHRMLVETGPVQASPASPVRDPGWRTRRGPALVSAPTRTFRWVV
jgi:hypothetical protein